MKELKLVMFGNGMAGVRTLEELRKIGSEIYDITVFGAEPYANYNRILLSAVALHSLRSHSLRRPTGVQSSAVALHSLRSHSLRSPVLAGEQTIKDIMLNVADSYAENNITLHLGKKITDIDRVRRMVVAEDGTTAEYDRLLLATGSNPFLLPVCRDDRRRFRLGDICRRQWRYQNRGRTVLRQAEDARRSAGIRRCILQLYREEGWYLERTVHYIGRVGLDHVKRSILEDSQNRKAFHERLLFSLDGEPGPWHEPEKALVDTRQFAPLAM
jgi:NAD(P)H-nitrite reductase large subunit